MNEIYDTSKWPVDFLPELPRDDPTNNLSPRQRVYERLHVDERLKQHLQHIASKNGWTYIEKSNALNDYVSVGAKMMYPTWKFAVREKYDLSACSHVVAMPFGHVKGYFFSYRYYGVDEDNDRKVNFAFSKVCVLQVDIPVFLPQILLDSKKNEGILLTSTIAAYKDNQIVSLEGDFDKHFQLYIPKGSHIDALSLLAPNAMELLMHTATPYDVEFLGNKMFIYTDKPSYSEKSIQEMATVAQYFLEYIRSGFAKDYSTEKSEQIVYLEHKMFSGVQLKIGKFRINVGLVILLLFLTLVLVILTVSRKAEPEIYISPEDRKTLEQFTDDMNSLKQQQ